jgi:hypothetical protein
MLITDLKFSSDGKNLMFRIITDSALHLLRYLGIKVYNVPEFIDISDYEATVRVYDDRVEYDYDVLLESISIEPGMNMLYIHAEDNDSNVVEDVCSYVADVFFCLYRGIMSLNDNNVSTPEYLLMMRLYMVYYGHISAIKESREEEAELLYDRLIEIIDSWPNKYLSLDPYPVINN